MNILVAVDLSDSSKAIIDYVKGMAGAFSGKIWLLHVAEPDPDFVGYTVDTLPMRDIAAEKYHEEHLKLERFSRELHSAGLNCTPLLMQGAIVETILKETDKLSINMLVVGSHGKGAVISLLVGSTSEGVLHKSSVPVLVVPTHGRY